MIATDRILGGAVAGFGVFLLLYLIPNYVTSMPGELRDPSLFPRIAAWMILVLGAIQVFLPGPNGRLPSLGEVGRAALVVVALTLVTLALPRIGIIAGGIVLMAFSAALMFEKRLLWLAVTVLFVPVCVWGLFEVLFGRPLP
ncbi:tripartite tricarboxylate transporter TctB family protein [Roseibium sp. Sym1]|uniref:tripartite tricarboxylate transporter TctB family protein n=1 Tax=Roseibium sp. Sym1 TaxID=3016006 RepID=UPI0022B2D3B0|nr:tripartite tricarboxylate transporter TctB family protein [Roseibium sp. Sym1]